VSTVMRQKSPPNFSGKVEGSGKFMQRRRTRLGVSNLTPTKTAQKIGRGFASKPTKIRGKKGTKKVRLTLRGRENQKNDRGKIIVLQSISN